MISFKICSDSLCLTTDNSIQVGTLDDMVRGVLESSEDTPVTEIRFGASYGLSTSGLGWGRVTFIVGKGRTGEFRTVGICDCCPDIPGKLLYRSA